MIFTANPDPWRIHVGREYLPTSISHCSLKAIFHRPHGMVNNPYSPMDPMGDFSVNGIPLVPKWHPPKRPGGKAAKLWGGDELGWLAQNLMRGAGASGKFVFFFFWGGGM